MPAIGRLERAPKVLFAFEHAHLGADGSAQAEIIAAIAAEKTPPVDIAPFRIERLG